MGKGKIVVGGAALVVIVAAAVAPYAVGQRMESRFRAQVKQEAARLGQPIKITAYHAGWLESRATTHMVFDGQPVDLRYDIHHGPYAPFAWARIRITPVRLGRSDDMKYYFGGPAFTATGTVNYGGGTDFTLRSPAFDKTVRRRPDAHLVWGGLHGHYHRRNNRVRLKLSIPKLAFKDNGRSFVAQKIRVVSDDHAAAVDRANIAPNWNGQALLSIAHLAVRNPAAPSHWTSGVKIRSSSHVQKNETVVFASDLTLSDLKIDEPKIVGDRPLRIPRARLKTELKGLQEAPLNELMRKLRGFNYPRIQNAASQRQINQAETLLARYVPRILSGSPSLNMDIPTITTGHGKISARVHILLKPTSASGSGARPAPAPAGLLTRLVVNARQYADLSLVHWAIKRSSHPARARERLQACLRDNLLEKKHGRIGMRIHYDDGGVKLNDQPQHQWLLLAGCVDHL